MSSEIISFSNKIGLWTVGNFIFGFPDEKPESVNKTLKFAQQSGLDMAIFYVVQPYAGSDLYSIYEKKGLLNPNLAISSSVVETHYDTEYYSALELVSLRNKASNQYLIRRIFFYLTPRGFFFSLLPKVNSFEKFRYFLKVVKMVMPNLNFSLRFLKRNHPKN